MTDRATARVVGVLFLVGTAAGLVGLPLQESVVGGAYVLEAALDGEVATTGFAVDQLFLVHTLVYVLVPIAMVVLSLLLPPGRATSDETGA